MLKLFGADPDAIAAIIGHEVGHLMKAHGVARQNRDTVLALSAVLAGLTADRNLTRRFPGSNPSRNLAALGTATPAGAFSREDELDADDTAVRLMRAAGFDPNGAARLWRIMPGRNFSFFATHPPSAERIAYIRSVIASLTPSKIGSAPTVAKPSDVSADVDYKEEAGGPDDAFILALQAYRAGRAEEARQSLLKSAEAGDARGQVAVGSFQLAGQAGFERDYKKASEYLELAQKQESALATYTLGTMHEDGRGFSRDPAKAAEFYQRAAGAGFADAVARLALMKMRGQGLPRDLPGALELATKSNAENSTRGIFILGLLYFSGAGVTRDVEKARDFFERNAARGHAQSEALLGGMHASATGVPLNFDLAAMYYQRAADKNDASAKANLGFLYLGGMGVQRDAVVARSLFEDAHKRGNSLGALGLGHLYRDGLTVQKDEVLALAYYEVAIRQGLTSAAKSRDELAARMNPQDVASARTRAESLFAAVQQ